MDLQERVNQHFQENIASHDESMVRLAPEIARASGMLVESLLMGKKILCCGTGGSAALAQYFASLLLNRYERERPGLPAIAISNDIATLTATAQAHGYQEIFAQHIRTLGQEGDVLLLVSNNCNKETLRQAISAGHDRGMTLVVLSSEESESVFDLLKSADSEIRAPVRTQARCQEINLTVIHSLCDLIDIQIFGEEL